MGDEMTDEEICTKAIPKAGARLGHDWPAAPTWGVLIGVARCRNCGQVASNDHFARPTNTERGR